MEPGSTVHKINFSIFLEEKNATFLIGWFIYFFFPQSIQNEKLEKLVFVFIWIRSAVDCLPADVRYISSDFTAWT